MIDIDNLLAPLSQVKKYAVIGSYPTYTNADGESFFILTGITSPYVSSNESITLTKYIPHSMHIST